MPKEPFRNIPLDWLREIEIATSPGDKDYIEGIFITSWVDKEHLTNHQSVEVFLKPDELDLLIVTLIEAKMKIEQCPDVELS